MASPAVENESPYLNKGNKKWSADERMPWPEWYFRQPPLSRCSLPMEEDEGSFAKNGRVDRCLGAE